MVEAIALSEPREGEFRDEHMPSRERRTRPGRGRPKEEVDPDKGPRHRLAWALWKERTQVAGRPSLRELAEESGLGHTTLQQAEYPTGRVSWETVQKHVEACWYLAERRGQTPARNLQYFRDLFDQLPEDERSAGPIKARVGEPISVDPAPSRDVDPAVLSDGSTGRRLAHRLPWPLLSIRGVSISRVTVVVLVVAALAGGGLVGFRMVAPSTPRLTPTPATQPFPCSTARPCTYQVEVGENLCLDQAVAYTPNRIDLWACWKGKNQRWIETHRGNQFTLSTQETPRLCVTAKTAGQLTMGSCGGPASLWTSTQNTDDGSYTFHSVMYRDMCLGAQGSVVDNRTPIVLQPCKGQAEVRWM
jgi:hypothetical protein